MFVCGFDCLFVVLWLHVGFRLLVWYCSLVVVLILFGYDLLV